MKLDEAIQRALDRLQQHMNEANLRVKVINNLLEADEVGYGQDDYDLEESALGGKPDYTILPHDKKHRFFLEAKAPDVELEEKHAEQATHYAYSNESRWAVLTNGRVWRLYDTKIMGKPGDRLVAEVNLGDKEQAIRFLAAIGKASVLGGAVEKYVQEEQQRLLRAKEDASSRARLDEVLESEIGDPNSPLAAVIWEHLRTREGFHSIQVDWVVDHFRRTAVRAVNQAPTGGDVCVPKSQNPKASLQLQFWSEFLAHVGKRQLSLFAGATIDEPDRDGNVNLELEEKGFAEKDCYLWFKLGPKRYLAGLWVETGSEKPNPQVYQFLLSRKADIEKALALRMNWDLWNGEQGIVYKGALAKNDLSDRANWPRLMEEMIDVMTRIHAAFAPHIQGMPKA